MSKYDQRSVLMILPHREPLHRTYQIWELPIHEKLEISSGLWLNWKYIKYLGPKLVHKTSSPDIFNHCLSLHELFLLACLSGSWEVPRHNRRSSSNLTSWSTEEQAVWSKIKIREENISLQLTWWSWCQYVYSLLLLCSGQLVSRNPVGRDPSSSSLGKHGDDTSHDISSRLGRALIVFYVSPEISWK